MYLLDTVAFSELFKTASAPNFVLWLSNKADGSLFLSAVTVGEVEKGIERQRDESLPLRGVCWPG